MLQDNPRCSMLLTFGLLFLSFGFHAGSSKSSFNVLDYGAVDDDAIDSSQAFLNAWTAACSVAIDQSTIIIPGKSTFLVNPIVFLGPCKAKTINFQILGTILAPVSPSAWEERDPSLWLAFRGVTGLNVYGTGTIDGRGSGWWNQSCRYHPTLPGCTKLAPTMLKFLSCNKTTLSNVQFIDSPQTHITIMACDVFLVNRVSISAPGNSPNTDGIHLQRTRNIIITNTRVGAGDDCISIGDYTSNVNIFNITCGPGHGISIGSLGRSGNFVEVQNIFVKNVYLKETTNGARIKTWQVGRGYVRKVIFENLYFDSVKNPIVIDQNYCDVRGACQEKETGVWVTDVTYKGLYGTSITDIAVNLNCSSSVACTKITFDSIVLWSSVPGKDVTSYCNNAYGVAKGKLQPESCLQDMFSIDRIMKIWMMNVKNR